MGPGQKSQQRLLLTGDCGPQDVNRNDKRKKKKEQSPWTHNLVSSETVLSQSTFQTATETEME